MIFRKALIRLTLAYSAIQLLLFALAGLSIYAFVSITFDFDVENVDGAVNGFDAADHALSRLRWALLFVYLGLILVVPAVSYVMARSALAPLRRSYERQQQFVDATSHEFRTPLGVMMGELSLALMRERTVQEYRAAIRESLTAVESLSTLTNQLLLLSQDDPGGLAQESTSVSVADLIADAVAPTHDAGANDPLVVTAVPDEARIVGNYELLVNALRNVIDNARKFTPPEGRVDVKVEVRDRFVTVTVADTGLGMSPAEVERAFDRFWRAPSSRDVAGHGLGLSLVNQIVVSQGGSVTIKSAQGRGTTVAITLPGDRA